MNTLQEKMGRVIDGSRHEGVTGSHSLKSDGLMWAHLVSEGEKGGAVSASHSPYSSNKMSQVDFDGSFISNGILKNIIGNNLGAEIKFSISLPGRQIIDVSVVENKNFWKVDIATHDNGLKKKIKRLQKGMERSIGEELDKRVVVCVK